MQDILIRIKRAVLAGNVVFTDKASIERELDGLTKEDVLESIITAVAIYKTVNSTSRYRGRRREYLHIIQSTNFEGAPVYSKGKLLVQGGIDTLLSPDLRQTRAITT